MSRFAAVYESKPLRRGVAAGAAMGAVLLTGGCTSAQHKNYDKPYQVAASTHSKYGSDSSKLVTFTARYRNAKGKPENMRPFQGVVVEYPDGSVDTGVISNGQVVSKYLGVRCVSGGTVTAGVDERWHDNTFEGGSRMVIQPAYVKEQQLCVNDKLNVAAGAANLALRIYNAQDNASDAVSHPVRRDALPQSSEVDNYVAEVVGPKA